MFRELDCVQLQGDLPSWNLKDGAPGTIVLVHQGGNSYGDDLMFSSLPPALSSSVCNR